MRNICTLFLLLLFVAARGANIENVGKLVPNYVCPLHFLPVNGKCYFFSKGKATWQNAFFKCEKYKSSLTVLSQPYEDIILRTFLSREDVLKNVTLRERWIGGRYDWKQKIWRWAASGVPLEYHGFSRMKPNQEFKKQWQCIVLDPRIYNKWSARNCMARKHFICETKMNNLPKKSTVQTCNKSKKFCSNNTSVSYNTMNESFPGFLKEGSKEKSKAKRKLYACPSDMILLGNKCYYFSKDEKTWDEAHFACLENKTRLAIIKSRRKDEMLKKILNGKFVESKERWIGGRYDWEQKLWRWAISGEKFHYNGFIKEHNRKNNFKWHSAIMDPKFNNQWNSRMDLEKKSYICQTKAQVVQFNGNNNNNNLISRYHLQTKSFKNLPEKHTRKHLKSNVFYYNVTSNPLYPQLITEEFNFH